MNYLPSGGDPTPAVNWGLWSSGRKGLKDFLSKHVIYFVIQNKTKKKKRINLDSIMYD